MSADADINEAVERGDAYQPHRKAVIWIRRDQVGMASNQPIWM